MRCIVRVSVVTAMVLLATAGAWAGPPHYVATDVDSLAGTVRVATQTDLGMGSCLNNVGQIAAVSQIWYDSPTPITCSVLWSKGAGMALLPSSAGGFWSALAVNNLGQVVGQGNGTEGNAVMWSSSAGVTPIPRIGGETWSTAVAWSVNDSGLVVGEDDGVGRAWAYNSATATLYDIGSDTSTLNGVSSSGLAVGVSYFSRVFLWTAAGGTTNLPNLNNANGISSNGLYVAAAAGGTGVGWNIGGAAIYNTATHAITTIGFDGNCWAVNNSGIAVGDTTVGGLHQPFVYEGGTTYALTPLMTPLPSGTTLSYAVAVNDSGQIVAEGTDALGYRHSYLLTPAMDGDANLDGTANLTDLSKILANYDKSGMTWAEGDFNADGTVNLADLSKLLANFDKTLGASAAGIRAVPEPGAVPLCLATLASLLLFAWRAKK